MAKIPEHLAREREVCRPRDAAAGRRVAASRARRRRQGTQGLRTHPTVRAQVQSIEPDEAVLTANAAHTWHATASAIIESGGYNPLIVKRNTPRLFGQIAEILLTGDRLRRHQSHRRDGPSGLADLAKIEQKHRGCEARHLVLDVTFGEDQCQARVGSTPANLSTLRDPAIDTFRAAGHVNIAHARRHHTHQPERALDLYEL